MVFPLVMMSSDFFENIRFIEPSLEHSQTLNTAVIAKSKSLTDFIKSHCHASHYAFQIKKCTSEECLYCSEHPIAMPKDDFEKLSFVPLPLLNEKKEHYQPFSELYGTIPQDKRPSLNESEGQDIDRLNKQLFN